MHEGGQSNLLLQINIPNTHNHPLKPTSAPGNVVVCLSVSLSVTPKQSRHLVYFAQMVQEALATLDQKVTTTGSPTLQSWHQRAENFSQTSPKRMSQ